MTDLYVTDEARIPSTPEDELKVLVFNYANLCGIDYSAAFQEFKE